MPHPKDPNKVEEWRGKISKGLLGKRCCMRTEFAKGHRPWNKGTKGLTKRNKTTFKKGNVPANYMGGMKVCKDGIYVITKRNHYKYNYKGEKIKVHQYEQLARKKWRDAYGDFPKEMIIYHKDGDILNNEIENLELITRKELLKRNSPIIKKVCSVCGKDFETINPRHKTCSQACYKVNCKILAKVYQQKYREEHNFYNRKWKAQRRNKLRTHKHLNTSDY